MTDWKKVIAAIAILLLFLSKKKNENKTVVSLNRDPTSNIGNYYNNALKTHSENSSVPYMNSAKIMANQPAIPLNTTNPGSYGDGPSEDGYI